jgi:uncharacterized protein with PQ loop repeat
MNWIQQLVEPLGWFGAAVFSLSALPQAWVCWRQKHSNGLAWPFLLSWLVGCSTMLLYVSLKGHMLPLQCNYGVNLALLLVIVWYKLFPRDPS